MLADILWWVLGAVLLFLFWRGGAWRVVGMVGLILAGLYMARRRDKRVEKILAAEKVAADAYGAKALHTARERQKRIMEARKARKAIEEEARKHEVFEANNAARISDLWNRTFGRADDRKE